MARVGILVGIITFSLRAHFFFRVAQSCNVRLPNWFLNFKSGRYCPDGAGSTIKDKNAVICDGGSEHDQVLLEFSLANKMFYNCASWCTYDAWSPEKAYQWSSSRSCWKPRTKYLCFNAEQEWNYAKNRLTEFCTAAPTSGPSLSPTPEPTACITVKTWSVETAGVCPEGTTGDTDKGYGTATACSSTDQASLEDGLANQAYSDCAATCVYDIWSGGQSAFLWDDSNDCYQDATWRDCDLEDQDWRSKNVGIVWCDTAIPTVVPTKWPTYFPSTSPTNNPTEWPSVRPTAIPSHSPTYSPTRNPTEFPTKEPSNIPTTSPTFNPTYYPTNMPTLNPTESPTELPTTNPSNAPSKSPTSSPTTVPTESPSEYPTLWPTTIPTNYPSRKPTMTKSPTFFPSQNPTESATTSPTTIPSDQPTVLPSGLPTLSPTGTPTITPTRYPSISPTSNPTSLPTPQPTDSPSESPSITPTDLPTIPPTVRPTFKPSNVPSTAPSRSQTNSPTISPTADPSGLPTLSRTQNPTSFPAFHPTNIQTQPALSPNTIEWTTQICCLAEEKLVGYINETITIITESLGIHFNELLLKNIQSMGGRRRPNADGSGTLTVVFWLNTERVTLATEELTEKLKDSNVLESIRNGLSSVLGGTIWMFATVSYIVQTSLPTLFPSLSPNSTGEVNFDDLTTSADSMTFFLGSFGLLVPLVIFLLPYSNSKGLVAQPFLWSCDDDVAKTAYDMLKFQALQIESVFKSWVKLTVLEIKNRHPLFTCWQSPFQNFSNTQRGIVLAAAFAVISVTQAYFYSSDPIFSSGSFQILSAFDASIVSIVLTQLFVNSMPGRMHHQFQRKKCKCNHRLDSVPQTIEGVMVDKIVDMYEDLRAKPRMEQFAAPITTKIRNFILDNDLNPLEDEQDESNSPLWILRRALKSTQGPITDEEFLKLVVIQNWVMKQTYSLPSSVISYTWILAIVIIYGCIALTITYAKKFDKDEDIHDMVFSQWVTGSLISFIVFLFLLPIVLSIVMGIYIFSCKKRNEKDIEYLEMILSFLLTNPKHIANGDVDIIIGWMHKRPSEVMMVSVSLDQTTRDTSVSPMELVSDIDERTNPSNLDYKDVELDQDEGVLSPSSQEYFQFGVNPGNRVEEPWRFNKVGEESPKVSQSFEFENKFFSDGPETPGRYVSTESSRYLRRPSKSITLLDGNDNEWQEVSIADAQKSVVLRPLEATSAYAELSEGGQEDVYNNDLGESFEEVGQLVSEQRTESTHVLLNSQDLMTQSGHGQMQFSEIDSNLESKVEHPIEDDEELDKIFGSWKLKNTVPSDEAHESEEIEITDRTMKLSRKEGMLDCDINQE
jgi:hypothetical protein